MAASDLVGGIVMDKAASLLNDTAKSVYTYAAQTPYLTIALQELRELFELNSVPVTQTVSTVIQVDSGVTSIEYNAAGTTTNPKLPDNFVEPLQLWERARGIDPYTPMSKRDFISHSLDGIQLNQFLYYTWNNQKIEFLSSNRNNDIKMDYILQLFPDYSATVDQNTQINVVNSATFLEFRVAALCAEFIERNTTSANSLNSLALLALDRVTGIGAKGKQNIATRRRPFRASYKSRGWMT